MFHRKCRLSSNNHELYLQNLRWMNGSNLSKLAGSYEGSLSRTDSVQLQCFSLTWGEPFYPVSDKLKTSEIFIFDRIRL